MADTMGAHKERDQLGFYRDKFTDAQRRRVEALVLVRYLFPSVATGRTQAEIAFWITKGKWSA